METVFKVNDPARAREYFERKLTFTTGPVELARALKAGQPIHLVDVRAAEDFAKGHIPDAINLPKENWNQLDRLRQDQLNVVYCYSQACHLAATAALEFATQGYPVMELEGGFETWKAADLEIERPPVSRLKRATGILFHKQS